jgi:hypothetical protein
MQVRCQRPETSFDACRNGRKLQPVPERPIASARAFSCVKQPEDV